MASLKASKLQIKEALLTLLEPAYLKQIGEVAAEMIRTRTRLGFGVAGEGKPRQKLKALSESYKKVRKGTLAFFTTPDGVVVPYKPKKPKVELSDLTTPSKSNLTLSGEMLDSVSVKEVRNSTVFIGPSGDRNERVAQYVEDQGRAFLNLSDIEIKRLEDQVRKDLQAKLETKLAKLR